MDLWNKRRILCEKVDVGDIQGLAEALDCYGLCIDPIEGCCGLNMQSHYKPLTMAVKKGRLDSGTYGLRPI